MDLDEASSKILLGRYGIPHPPFKVISQTEHTDAEIESALVHLGVTQAVVKAQVLAGGRGKGGGIRFAKSREEVFLAVHDLLGKFLKTAQTKGEGLVIKKVLLTPLVSIEKELYLALLLDRSEKAVVLLGTSEGGMDIEEVAKKSPEKILRKPLVFGHIPLFFELLPFVKGLQIEKKLYGDAIFLIQSLVKAFFALDATLMEINPLVITKEGKLSALDAKISIDDNSLFRHKELAAFFDHSHSSDLEKRAEAHELAYVSMEGTIGCMVNGAGLAMATMDIIESYGKKAANFLDVGGSATKEKIAEAFRILLEDPKVKGVLVNIFGGIMSCETIAEAMIEVAREKKILFPIVVRMEGNRVEEGRKKLESSSLSFKVAKSLKEAAEKIAQEVA